jgi:hypothetical protein
LNFMTERRKNSRTKLEERLCKGTYFMLTQNPQSYLADAVDLQFSA